VLLERKYKLRLVERCQFMWRNVVLRNHAKEEILVKRALSRPNVIEDFIAKSLEGLQVAELDEWVIWNLFKRGITLKKTGIVKVTFREGDV